MKNKIEQGVREGKYEAHRHAANADSYWNARSGWWDHLLGEKAIFSHRESELASFPLADPLHAHDYYELLLLSEGEGIEYVADGKRIRALPDTAILTKPRRFHTFRFPEAFRYNRYVIYFKEPADFLPELGTMDFTKKGSASFATFSLPRGVLLSHAKAVETALSEPSPHGSAKAFLALCHLFLALSDANASDAEPPAPPKGHFINEIKEYIDDNFLTIRSVAQVAERFFYSREYVSRSFRQYYNTPLYEYVLERRILYCTSLLHRGEPVERAARESGFGNLSSFIKVFRRFYGCTPSEYRARREARTGD